MNRLYLYINYIIFKNYDIITNFFSDMDSVIFKKENIAIASIGMKRLTTDKFVSIIDHNDLEVKKLITKDR